MNILVLKKFNNYFNRKIIKYDSLEDYQDASSSNILLTGINFNPNDGVRTELVLGQGSLGTFFDFEKTNAADYLVCYSVDPGSDESDDSDDIDIIESRWFITEVKRTRGGQYLLQLKRDSIADNFDTLLSCPAFIRKGTLQDDDPLIVNDEGVKVNQIKSSETLLKDGSNSAWIVGYMAKGAPSTAISAQIPDDTSITSETIENLASDFGVSAADLDAALTSATDNPSYFVNDNIELVGWLNIPDSRPTENRVIAGSSNFLTSFTYSSEAVKDHNTTSDCLAIWHNYWTTQGGTQVTKNIKNYWLEAAEYYKANIKSSWKTWTGHPLFTRPLYNRLIQMQNNNVYIYKQSKYYRVRVASASGPTNTGELYPVSRNDPTVSNMASRMITRWNTAYPNHYLEPLTGGRIFVNYNELVVNFYLEEVTDFSDIPGIDISMSTTRNAILSQPYDMFAIPASNTQLKIGANTYDVIGEYAQKTAMALVEKLTSSNVYDVQLLPYCPIPELAKNNTVDITSLTSAYDYDLIYQTTNIARDDDQKYTEAWEDLPGQYEAVAVFDTDVLSTDTNFTYGYTVIAHEQYYDVAQVTNVAGKKRITVSMPINHPQDADEIEVYCWWTYTGVNRQIKSVVIYPKDNSFSASLNYNLGLVDSMKIDSQTDMYRLVSPNYQGTFEFNVAKNGGAVNGFIAECTYKPYTPHIKVAPNFSWLYGTNFGDARGLICGGDFSIGIMNSAWQEYQLQNKNYQNIFNREIQNMDIQQGIRRTQQYVSGGINILNSAAQGATTGAIASGSPWGAVAGGVIAGGASAAGYAADNALMERSLIEQRQLAYDKFSLQLGNIQALPYTLTKVGSFDINSKIWPFLEYYTCTDTEKEALKQKIKYEGMTVGIIDVLSTYMTGGYLQADLIRNDDIIDDSHLLEDIYIELTKGVYL